MELPIIERTQPIEVTVNGICRVVNLGSLIGVDHFQLAREPNVNGGQLFRAPNLRVIWTMLDLKQHLGCVGEAIRNGCANIELIERMEAAGRRLMM